MKIHKVIYNSVEQLVLSKSIRNFRKRKKCEKKDENNFC